MTPLVPIALYGWIPLGVMLFASTRSSRAATAIVIAGVLFLPVYSLNFPIIRQYDKGTAIALSLLFAGLAGDSSEKKSFSFSALDIPMFLWCLASPVASSLSNGLGINDAVLGVIDRFMQWGVPYWAGRKHISSPRGMKDLTQGIAIGGLAYIPLALFELRMSPQLSNIVYGFFPHSFLQHVRYGGYRPIIFMSHGLMVALWFAAAFAVAVWLWRTKTVTHLVGLPMIPVVLSLMAIGILAKSANGWAFLMLSTGSIVYFNRFKSTALFRILLLVIPAYIVLRLAEVVSTQQLLDLAARVVDEERVASLGIRLRQEGLFGANSMLRPVFGWGWMGRAWPYDRYTGAPLIRMVDSFFVITMGTRGLFGLVTVYSGMLLGPWAVFTAYSRRNSMLRRSVDSLGPEPIVLGLIVVFFMLDSLVNSMVNQVYIFSAGALISYYMWTKNASDSSLRVAAGECSEPLLERAP